MVINIASFGGRTHMLDTARELEKHGHVVRFYSYVPTKRAIKLGLKKECSYSIFYWVLPFLALFKFFGFGGWRSYLYYRFCDLFLAYYMKPCDIFIGQSPMHNYSIRYFKKKYNAITILERGISHVLEYHSIISKITGKPSQSQRFINWDLNGYIHPDYISVGAEHVKDSFTQKGYPDNKIFVNNYGFNSIYFHSTSLDNSKNIYDLIFVGNWSIRKGSKLITEYCKKHPNIKFIHVGAISDISFPTDVPNMTHIDSVQEYQLISYYSKSRVFILPSYLEGLALVQTQAAACGLPIICSKQSGGRDLWKYTKSKEWIIELEELSLKEIEKAVNKALLLSNTQKGKRNYLTDKFQEASWTGYGNRYNEFIQIINNHLP